MMVDAVDYCGQFLTNVRSFKRRSSWGARLFVAALIVSVVIAAVSLAVLFKVVSV